MSNLSYKENRALWIAISFLIFLFLFTIFEFSTGGIYFKDSENWEPNTETETVVGDFKPSLSFHGKSKIKTIIPAVLGKLTIRSNNWVSVYLKWNYDGYNEKFEYVRFTKLKVHYHSNHIQDFLLENSFIKEKKFLITRSGSLLDIREIGNKRVFHGLKLNRIERCTIIVEGYSKLNNDEDEKFFSYTGDWYISKKKSMRTGYSLYSRG